MKKTKVLSCIAALVILMSAMQVFIPEASAALRPYNYMGTVVSKDIPSETITIQTEYDYGGTGLTPEWIPYSCTLEGVSPNGAALSEINVGDYVEAHSLGAPGGDWVTLAKLKSSTEKVITDIYGDPAGTCFSLLDGYKIDYKNTPDCSKCYGINCDASYTTVNVYEGSTQIVNKLLYPSQNYVYQGEAYHIDITFLSGQAPSYPECTDERWVGPQAISNFVIHIRATTCNKPDLIIKDISWSPPNPKEGENITYYAKVKNIGEASAKSCTVELNRSLEGGYAAFYTLVPSLDADETITIHFPVIETTVCGIFPVRAIADVYNDVEESNEGNNERIETMSVTCVKPDMTIQDITWSPGNPEQGDTILFTVVVKNQGSGPAGSSAVKYYVDGSTVDSDSVPALSAGSTSTQTFTWTASKCGGVPVKAVADANKAVDEIEEGNNEKLKTVSVACQLMEGDVTLDGYVTITDARDIGKYKAGLISLNADQLLCADTTDDGAVTMIDVMHILQWKVDPDRTVGILYKPLWESPADDGMRKPVE